MSNWRCGTSPVSTRVASPPPKLGFEAAGRQAPYAEFLGLPNLKAAHIPELIHSLRPVTHPREIAKTHQSRDGACPVSLFCPIPRPLI